MSRESPDAREIGARGEKVADRNQRALIVEPQQPPRVDSLEVTEVELKRATQALSAHAKALKLTALTTAEEVSS